MGERGSLEAEVHHLLFRFLSTPPRNISGCLVQSLVTSLPKFPEGRGTDLLHLLEGVRAVADFLGRRQTSEEHGTKLGRQLEARVRDEIRSLADHPTRHHRSGNTPLLFLLLGLQRFI